MNKSMTIRMYRIFFGLLALSSVLTEVIVICQRGTFDAGNFFSYFTIESNIFAALVLIVVGYMNPNTNNFTVGLMRGAATLYMLITGIVFAVLLSGIKGAVFTAVPWDNIVLHYVMPIVLAIDWLVSPPSYRFRFKQILPWLLYPSLYVVYTVIRGRIVEWYPYPFFDPTTHGTIGIAMTILGIVVLTLGCMYILLWSSRTLSKRHLR